MCRANLSLSERMVYFYHTHFTTIQSRANYGSALYYQNQLFRHYALGNVKTLATKLCYDSAMLMHLDGRYNRVGKPNENFAREFLELFSIGKGARQGARDYTHYTEYDVQQAARVFSGFQIDETFSKNIDPTTGLPMGQLVTNHRQEPSLHDFGSKVFSERFGGRTIRPTGTDAPAVMGEIENFVEMVFERPETARHICRKLYRFFVYHRISDTVEEQVIVPLARQLQAGDYEIQPVLETLLSSQHFYDRASGSDRQIRGALVKSPLELVLGMLRYFEVALPDRQNLDEFYTLYGTLFYRLEQQNMRVYEPPEVAGYPAYHQAPNYNRAWITSSTLAHRYQFAYNLIDGIRRRGYSTELNVDLFRYFTQGPMADPGNAETLVRALTGDLLALPATDERLEYFTDEVLLDKLSMDNWKTEWQAYRQTGGQAPGARAQLQKLLVAVMQTPEYQLF